jgi:hypothetical protein
LVLDEGFSVPLCIEHVFDTLSLRPMLAAPGSRGPVGRPASGGSGVAAISATSVTATSISATSVTAAFAASTDRLHVGRGQVAALIGSFGSGLTRIGLSLLAEHAHDGPVACLDVRGWISPPAAWEVGIPPERFLVARCDEVTRWGRAAAALLDGVRAVYAEVPNGVRDSSLRTLGALARRNRTPLVLRSLGASIPSGMAVLRIEARGIAWEGTDHGHGRLERRLVQLVLTGKAVQGMTRFVEVEDDGADALCVVPGMGAAEAGRATG